MSDSENNQDHKTWEGTSLRGWLVTALLLFVSFWDLDLVVHNAPFEFDFNFSGFIVLLVVWLNQSRYFRLVSDHLGNNHLDIDGLFNAADIPLDSIKHFKLNYFALIGYTLTIDYHGKATSKKSRFIFLSHIRNHPDLIQALLQELPTTTEKTISKRYQEAFLNS